MSNPSEGRANRDDTIDLGPRAQRLPWDAEMSALFAYALITFAVVIAAADAEPPHHTALLLAGNALALWVAHAHAASAAHDRPILHALGHAAPVLALAVPGCATLLLGALLGWTGAGAVIAAEVVQVALLVTLQLLASRRRRFTRRQVAMTVLLDAVAALVVVLVIKLLK